MQALQFTSQTQADAFNYGPFPACAAGDFGAGKTWIWCLKALYLSDTFPQNRGVIVRRVQKELRLTTMATFYKICPPSAYRNGRRNDGEGICQLNNGSEILFFYLDDPEIATVLRGLEINWFLIDQAEENPDRMEELFDLLRSRLGRWEAAQVPQVLLDRERAQGREWPYLHPDTGAPMPPAYAMLACNRDVIDHWIYRRFHPDSIEHQRVYRALGYRMFEMDAADNRNLSEINKRELRSQAKGFIGTRPWGLPEGTIHPIADVSLIPGSPAVLEHIRSTCILHRGLHHGDSTPTCCLWAATNRAGDVYIYREYHEPQKLVSDHRKAITTLSAGESYAFNLADPRIFLKPQAKLEKGCVADEYTNTLDHDPKTALYWSSADDNEFATRNKINEYLKLDPEHTHPFTKQKGAPRLYFITATEAYPEGCIHVVNETRSQRRQKIGMNLGAPLFSDKRVESNRQAAYHALRYLMAARASLTRVGKPDVPRGSMDWWIRETERYRRTRRA